MKMQFEVAYQDGRKMSVTAKPKDFVAFERQYGRSMTEIAENAPLEWLYYLAWSPLHRSAQEPGDFDAFLDVVDDVTPVEDAEAPTAADPTQPEPSPALLS